MVGLEELERMEQTSLDEIGSDSLTDITGVSISGDTSRQRLESLASCLKNLYCFKVDKTPVKIIFDEEGPTLEKTITRYFVGLKKGLQV